MSNLKSRAAKPLYSCTLPSTKKQIRFRPFTVAEEKVLMLAGASGTDETPDQKEMANAIETVIGRCLDAPLDVASLPMFDIEYLILLMRAKSVGETISIRALAPDDDKTLVDVEININDINVVFPEKYSPKVKLSEGTVVVMRPPGLEFLINGFDVSDMSASSTVLAKCIFQICDDDSVIDAKDETLEDLVEWVDSCSLSDYMKLRDFLSNLPTLRYVHQTTNPVTGNEIEFVFEGLSSFFV